MVYHCTNLGVSATLGYVSLGLTFQYLKERTVLLIGLIAELIICILLFILSGSAVLTFRAAWIEPVFGLGCAVFAWFLSYVVASASTIISKSQKQKYQSRTQSLRVALEKCVMVLSNLWMGSWLHNFQIGWIFSLVGLLVAVVAVIMSWKYLNPDSIEKLEENQQKQNGKVPTNGAIGNGKYPVKDDSFDTIDQFENSCYVTDTEM